MRKLATALTAVAVAAPSAFAASTATLKVSPSPVAPGATVRAFGSVGSACKHKGKATVYSRAFSSKQKLGGVPAVRAAIHRKGKFSVKVKIRQKALGTYKVSARCAGKKFATTKLDVSQGY
jgi:hypothetical protein